MQDCYCDVVCLKGLCGEGCWATTVFTVPPGAFSHL